MSEASLTLTRPNDETPEAAAIVERFLQASMVPDPQTAAQYIGPGPRKPHEVEGWDEIAHD